MIYDQTVIGVWKKLILTVMDDFEVSKTSVRGLQLLQEELTTDVGETLRGLELEVKMSPNGCHFMVKL
jgi:hypothetical protein